MSYNTRIEKSVQDVLGSNNLLPVPVESIVQSLGIALLAYDFKEDMSGILVFHEGKATIGYNKNEHRVRNRFTIAHELGHYILHRNNNELFVDKDFKVMFRSDVSMSTYSKHEAEANEFAACLLMPERLLRAEISKLYVDYTDESLIKTLAKKFDVSAIAMSIRISKLNMFFQH